MMVNTLRASFLNVSIFAGVTWEDTVKKNSVSTIQDAIFRMVGLGHKIFKQRIYIINGTQKSQAIFECLVSSVASNSESHPVRLIFQV